MKVLHVFHELKYSGAEIMYTAASRIFNEKNIKLYAAATSSEIGDFAPQFRNSGFTLLHWEYNTKKVSTKKYCEGIIAFIKSEKIDLLHIHSSGMRLIMSYCAWKSGCKSIYTFHNVFPTNWYSYTYHILQRFWIKNVFKTRFQTISNSVTNHELNYYFNKTTQVLNWYDSNRFHPENTLEKSVFRKKIGVPEDALVIISIGGCSEIKRHSHVLKALQLIISNFPNTFYLHLGDGNCHQKEKDLAKELGVENNVFFLGNQDDVRQYIIASDIYVMPSKFEGIPITTIETMACKVPCILYSVPGLKDFNQNMKCSILISESYTELAKTITTLYSNKELIDTITENAYALVNENFDMNKNVAKIIELYQ